MSDLEPDRLLERYERAKSKRANWESHWRECYEYAMPQRDGSIDGAASGEKKTDRLFDGTAPDAVDQLAASLMAELTPPWARWFELVPGIELLPEEAAGIAAPLEETSQAIQSNFDRSNFAVEIHQCFLDLVTIGTASLLFEEAPLGEPSAFRFTAIPVGEAVLEEGGLGRLDVTYRKSSLTRLQMRARFPNFESEDELLARSNAGPNTEGDEKSFDVLEAVSPEEGRGYRYLAILLNEQNGNNKPFVLREGRFQESPFLNFRWMKAPGEIYGRSPVMKALPDIKTANKTVELVLKNATISVTGIWQADDDGVLNPATVRLAPGTIIPKAVGSSGLTPLAAPGRFDVSQIVLDDMRARIRHALLADQLGPLQGPQMTATEVMERSAQMARMLSATYGRLQAELLNPLANRALAILRRRGEVPDVLIDGREVDLSIVSPIARQQKQAEAQGAMQWFQSLQAAGPQAMAVVNADAAARWLAKAFNVPETILNPQVPTDGQGAGKPGAQAGAAPGGAMAAGTDPMAALADGLAGGLPGGGAANPLANLAGALGGMAGAAPQAPMPQPAAGSPPPHDAAAPPTAPVMGGGNV